MTNSSINTAHGAAAHGARNSLPMPVLTVVGRPSRYSLSTATTSVLHKAGYRVLSISLHDARTVGDPEPGVALFHPRLRDQIMDAAARQRDGLTLAQRLREVIGAQRSQFDICVIHLHAHAPQHKVFAALAASTAVVTSMTDADEGADDMAIALLSDAVKHAAAANPCLLGLTIMPMDPGVRDLATMEEFALRVTDALLPDLMTEKQKLAA